MNTPLQSASLTGDEQTLSQVDTGELEGAEEEEHIHMPNPSYWPLIVGFGAAIATLGILFINTTPWVLIIGGIIALVGIIGWGVENPFAALGGHGAGVGSEFATSYAEAANTGKATILGEQLLAEAQDIADRVVTVGDIPWSAHPVSVEIEREGVVLSLYGRIELEAQRKELEQALLKLPGVIDVKNFVIAEDAILNAVNARIEKLRADGKLEGAHDISALVENYIVSLYGYTPNEKMKSTLERELLGIPGVRVVINHIGLDESIPGNLGRTSGKVGKITQ